MTTTNLNCKVKTFGLLPVLTREAARRQLVSLSLTTHGVVGTYKKLRLPDVLKKEAQQQPPTLLQRRTGQIVYDI